MVGEVGPDRRPTVWATIASLPADTKKALPNTSSTAIIEALRIVAPPVLQVTRDGMRRPDFGNFASGLEVIFEKVEIRAVWCQWWGRL
jgi:hypothetical protein